LNLTGSVKIALQVAGVYQFVQRSAI